MSDIRVRFAPSPTGFLHVGGIRTALFNYLFAKKNGGKFLLRIEDTDKTRSSREMVDIIIDSFKWLGLEIDDYIVYQSDNEEFHKSNALKLLEKGYAYYCKCTPEEYNELKKQAQSSGKTIAEIHECRNLEHNYNKGYALRFKVPQNEEIKFHDIVHGEIKFSTNEIEDFVLLRGDQTPTYQIAVVSDDNLMRVTHIIRGDDHISNTPKQILIYKALGFAIPEFAHLPLIMGPNGKKLSKRDGTVSFKEYEQNGYLPEAFINFIALLGWSDGTNNEYFTLEDLINKFSLENISKKNSIFDIKKFDYINGLHIKNMDDDKLADILYDFNNRYLFIKDLKKDDYFIKAVKLFKGRIKTLKEFFEYSYFCFTDEIIYEEKAIKKFWKDKKVAIDRLNVLYEVLKDLNDFNEESIENTIRGKSEEEGIKAAEFIHPLRVALTGFSVSPGIFELVELLGKEKVLVRIRKAIDFLLKMN